jgi:uncharacterized membrane protein
MSEPQSSPSPGFATPNALACPAGSGWAWLRRAWEIFRRHPGTWVGLFLASAVLIMILSILPLVSIFASLLQPVLQAGLMVAARKGDRGEELDFNDLFAGFKERLWSLVGVGGFSLLFSVVALILGIAAAMTVVGVDGLQAMVHLMGPHGAMHEGIGPELGLSLSLGMMAFALVALLCGVPLIMAIWFAPALVIFRGVDAWPALMQSIRGCMRNAVPLFMLGLILMPLMVLASLPLMLGWLVLGPVTVIAVYTSYGEVYGDR